MRGNYSRYHFAVAIAAALVAGLTLQVVAQPQITPSPPWPRRCSTISTPPAELVSTGVRTIEAALYLTILQLKPSVSTTQPLLVEAASIPIPPNGTRDRALVESLPKELRAALSDGIDQCFAQTADRFPPGTRLVPIEELAQALRTRGPTDWASFVDKFDGIHMWFGLSRAVISSDRRNAIVFYERICGNCGEGAWVWFQRSSLERPWKLMRRMPFWIG